MAVTKTVPVERILRVLGEHNIQLIGENRWQEAKSKLPSLPPGTEKHFIGHLQTNKVKEVVEAFDCIETVDSLKLAKAINAINKPADVFLQVNVSQDPAKHGFLPNELEAALSQIQLLKNLNVTGLMTITAKQTKDQTRQDFRMMKQLQTKLGLQELSMGMSDDWQIAVEEGATIVRLGSALFGQRISAKL